MKRPRMRVLEAIPHEEGGQWVVLVRDPQGLSPHMATLSPELAQFLFTFLDGTRTVGELEALLAGFTGEREDLTGLVSRLDEALFLDSPRFARRSAELLAAYRAAGTRPAALADSYPEDARAFLDEFYEGLAPPPEWSSCSRSGPRLRAVAIPHLDLRSGGRTAARGLLGAAEAFSGDTVVVLGVGHHLGRMPYALTGLPFETPLGTVEVARDLLDRVAGKAGGWLFEEELAHAGEHSVEYAALLLRHAFGDRPLRILPVLCGSFHHFLAEGRDPRDDPLVGAFVETLAEEAGDALVVASVDLAHQGPHYGDERPLDDADLARTRAADREMLDRLAAADAAGFFLHLAACGDERRVCGLSALFTTVAMLPAGARGELLAYEQPAFPEPGNTVTICAMNWTA